VKDGSSQITEVEEAQTYVKQVETARAEEAAKYGELTLSKMFSDAPVQDLPSCCL